MSQLVLASASTARLAMLQQAGLDVIADPASVDESEMKLALRADGAPVGDVAEALAEMKARRVSSRRPGAIVVGADQMLECNGVWFDKPPDLDHARAQLTSLRGKSHMLVSSVVTVRDGGRLWHHTDRAALTMRPFSDDFLNRYLDRLGEAVLGTVGGYRLEGLGAQLFSRIEGDYFTILGMPLLPLLEHLRQQRTIAA